MSQKLSEILPKEYCRPEGYCLQATPKEQSRGTVILFHGLTGTPLEMSGLAQFLHHKHFNVVVPRLSGHGEGIEVLKRTRAAEWLDDAEKALQIALDIGSRPVHVIGLSFGALLALTLVERHRNEVDKVVVLSPPLCLRSFSQELLLNLAATLPEWILDYFGVRQKTVRPPNYLAFEHVTYSVHSIGAGARLMKIRKPFRLRRKMVDFDMLLLWDPEDHHIVAETDEVARAMFPKARITAKQIHGGQHELLLGHKYQSVYDEVAQFLETA